MELKAVKINEERVDFSAMFDDTSDGHKTVRKLLAFRSKHRKKYATFLDMLLSCPVNCPVIQNSNPAAESA